MHVSIKGKRLNSDDESEIYLLQLFFYYSELRLPSSFVELYPEDGLNGIHYPATSGVDLLLCLQRNKSRIYREEEE